VRRAEVYQARLDPVEGSEQAGTRPVIVVSRDAINASSTFVLVVPCTTHRVGQRVYPSQILIRAPEGGLEVDTVALAEQVRALAKKRFGRLRGVLNATTMGQLEKALIIALDLAL
jgi:mRNA interferase MazF